MEPVIELRQLRYFVAVAEELHFGRAAQRLGIRAHTINSTNRDAWDEIQQHLRVVGPAVPVDAQRGHPLVDRSGRRGPGRCPSPAVRPPPLRPAAGRRGAAPSLSPMTSEEPA